MVESLQNNNVVDNVFGRSISFTSKSLQNNFEFISKIAEKCRPHLGLTSWILLILIYHGYLVAAAIHNFTKATPLICVSVAVWIGALLNWISQTKIARQFCDVFANRLNELMTNRRATPIAIKLSFILILVAFTIIQAIGDLSRLSGSAAYVFFLISMTVMSEHHRHINWNVVINALLMHYCFALILFQWPAAQWFFQQFASLVVAFLDFAQIGAQFVFGFIADPPNICDLRPVFIFTSLQTLIYFAAVASILFYFGIIQWMLVRCGWLMRLLIGTTSIESMNAWACTFLGMTEAPLIIAPYVSRLTDSEMFTILTSGFSCVAGTVFAAYVALGACPIYLLTASLLSAPCSLACSKIMFPETEETRIKDDDFQIETKHDKGFFDSLCSSGVAMIPTVFAIGATLLVVMSLLALLDTIMLYIGELIGYNGWSFQMLFGYFFFPFAYLMGVTEDAHQTLLVAQLMGTKTAVNEFVAYNNLGNLQKNQELSPKSVLIATYALCGFSNFSSMGMQIEFIGSLAPTKRPQISKMMLKAMIAGSIACFLNATVAGMLISQPIICQSTKSNSTCFRIDSN